MGHCPQCGSRLRVWSLLKPNPPDVRQRVIVCPGCQARLRPKLWSVLLPVAAASVVAIWVGDLLQAAGHSLATRIVGQLVVLLALSIPLYILVVRFHLKSPPSVEHRSILRTDDTDDEPNSPGS
jgi:hypothetical protein